MESGTAMTRCRDRIIERSKWLCSVVLMSAAGAAVFGVAGADGRGGSHWANAHATPAHTRVVHAPSGFSSHVTPVQTHKLSFSSYVAPAQSHVSASPTVSAATPATTHHAASAHKTASKRVRAASSESSNTTDASTAGAASGALGALAGSDTQVTTCPADGSQTTSSGDTGTAQSTGSATQ